MIKREIIIGFLKNRTDDGKQFDKSTLNSLCSNINRDLPILIAKVKGARKTIDVGLSAAGGEDLSRYEPYKRAGFSLFHPEGTTENDRITQSLQQAFEKGYNSVVLLSHSVPNLPTDYIEEALADMRGEKKIVLGPLNNGGFYLIGLTRYTYESDRFPEVSRKLCFCNGKNKEKIIRSIEALGISLLLLPEWYIVRTPEDLKRLCREHGKGTEWNARWTRITARDIF